MKSRMIPNENWGTIFVDEVQMTDTQLYGCATCGQPTQVIYMVNGTIYCKDDKPDAQA